MLIVIGGALGVRALWLALMYGQANDGALLMQTPDSWRYVQIGTYYAGLPYTGPPLEVRRDAPAIWRR